MRKQWFFLLILAVLLLAACSPASSANPTVDVKSTQPAQSAQTNSAAGTQKTVQPTTAQSSGKPEMVCQVISLSPTQGPTEASMFPPVSKDDHILGKSDNPKLTIIEYSDFQCPYCAAFAPIVEQFQQKHPDEVRVVFRLFPLPTHPLSIPSAEAAEAASLQGKFWEMHNLLFSEQGTWATMTEADFKTWVLGQGEKLGLDKTQFAKDIDSKAITDKVTTAQKHGSDIGIPGTPTVLLNGQYYQGPRDVNSLESVFQLFKLESRQFNYCPPMQIDPKKQYTATLTTEKGDIVMQLFPDKAPMAVNNFVFLARQGWFDDVTFHRVITGFIAQAGDPSGSGYGGPGYSFDTESSDLKFDKAGMVGMANAGAGTNGSQFFITFKAAPDLDKNYTIFGQVIEGLDVAEKLTPRDPSQSTDLPPGDKILKVTIKEK